jgi:hypothetical protein
MRLGAVPITRMIVTGTASVLGRPVEGPESALECVRELRWRFALPRVKETSRTLAAFAAVLRSVREMRRLSLEDVARRTSISVANLRLMEDGFYDPLLGELFEVSSALHMRAGELVRLVERALTEPQP